MTATVERDLDLIDTQNRGIDLEELFVEQINATVELFRNCGLTDSSIGAMLHDLAGWYAPAAQPYTPRLDLEGSW